MILMIPVFGDIYAFFYIKSLYHPIPYETAQFSSVSLHVWPDCTHIPYFLQYSSISIYNGMY